MSRTPGIPDRVVPIRRGDAQPSLLDDAETLEAYRRELIERAVETGTEAAELGHPEYFDLATGYIVALQHGETFTSDDISARFGRSRAAGAVIRSAHRRGLIEPVGITTSSSVTRHGGLLRRWRRT